MARVTYFVVLPFVASQDGEILAEDALEAQSADAARRKAERLADSKAGVVAFSRSGDPDLGDFDDAIVLAKHGRLPDDVAKYMD